MPVIVSSDTQLAATDSQDVARVFNFIISNADFGVFGITENKDTASISVLGRYTASLASSEAKDIAAIFPFNHRAALSTSAARTATNNRRWGYLKPTEATDRSSVNLINFGPSLSLSVTENSDTVTVPLSMSIVAFTTNADLIEPSDSFTSNDSPNVVAITNANLTVTEPQDQAYFFEENRAASFDVTEAVDIAYLQTQIDPAILTAELVDGTDTFIAVTYQYWGELETVPSTIWEKVS